MANSTPAELIRDELLHELFETTVDRAPDSIAIESGDTRISYIELERRANQLARSLRQRGIGPEDRVAILFPRSERVYEAMLGVLKAGAAYVPIDWQTPPDRLSFVLKDCKARCVISLSPAKVKHASALDGACPIICLDSDDHEISKMSDSRLNRTDTGAGRQTLCYIIYTSGTTGKPKGTLIEHHSAAHLVRAESKLYGIRPDDRILQFASIAFDASVEEIWMAFFHGATLVAASQDMIHADADFSRILGRLGVTVFSCVPTFLAMLEEDIPSVRLLILGGEACSAAVVERWHRPGRMIFNTYGPTEATVIASATILQPGKPVTIGKAIDNYQIFLMGPELKSVNNGTTGEICIAGEGLARGYIHRPELEHSKFVTIRDQAGASTRLYRTGDLGRINTEGDIEYLGRADDQVKIRGYRIELSEIDAVLCECPGVLAAAACVHEETQRIAAFIVRHSGQEVDRVALRGLLAKRLPPYMMPAFLDELAELPLGVSGKVDRKKLPAPKTPLADADRPAVGARTDAERTIISVWKSVLAVPGISAVDDFFIDLGGHSLLAAVAVSKLRKISGFEQLSIADLYANPTVEKLARSAQDAGPDTHQPLGNHPEFQPTPTKRYRLCAVAQGFGVLFLSGLNAWQWLGAFLTYGYLAVADWPVRKALLAAVIAQLITTPIMLVLSIVLKWALLGRIKPGRYPLWGLYYFKFWFVRSVMHATPLHYLAGTPLLNIYYRLMGAKIGRNVYFGNYGSRRSNGLMTFDLASVGEGTSIGTDTMVDGSSVEGGMLCLAPVTIGRDCWIGNRCSVGSGAVMEDGSGLGDLSMLSDHSRIPAGKFWKGSPAAPAGNLEPETSSPTWNFVSGVALAVCGFLFPFVIMLAVFPGLMFITHLGHADEGYSFLFVSPLIALSFVVFLCLEAWVCKWLLLGRLREGRYPVGGFFYIRKWFFDQIMDMSLEVTEMLYTTLYLQPWIRALGARIGPRSEIDAIRFQPDLFTAGEECFLGGDVLIGAPRIRSGWVTLKEVHAGKRLFGGACSVLPGGTTLGNNVLVGTLSIPPENADRLVPDGTGWFGSPAIFLPTRKGYGFSEEETFRPPKRLIALRLFIEFFRVILPSTIFVALASMIINITDILQDYGDVGLWILALPLLYLAAGVVAIVTTILLKRLLIGRYKAGEKPLWCNYVWRSELVAGIYGNLCVQFYLDLLRGTPFIAWALRGLGMKIGRRCYIDTTWFADFDLVEIGDEAALNDNSSPVTQLFEGRVMRMGRVKIGNRCVLGAEAVLQYDTEMGDESSLGELSMMMKGERLPEGTVWHGIPARRKTAKNN